jgi:PCI domain
VCVLQIILWCRVLQGADAAIAHFAKEQVQQCLVSLGSAVIRPHTLIVACSRPSDQRAIPIADIARVTKLTDDGVEFLLMKALSLHLIEGSIDQVAGTVQVRGCAGEAAAQRAASKLGCMCQVRDASAVAKVGGRSVVTGCWCKLTSREQAGLLLECAGGLWELYRLAALFTAVFVFVQVSWVQPRVLTLPQIDGLLSRLGAWISKVSTAATMLQDESTGLI